jgi:hypothetical protein
MKALTVRHHSASLRFGFSSRKERKKALYFLEAREARFRPKGKRRKKASDD